MTTSAHPPQTSAQTSDAHPTQPGPRATASRRLRRPARPRPLAVDALAAAAGLGLGASLALAVSTQTSGSLSARGGLLTAAGMIAGMLAGYAMICVVLLSARIPPLERTMGQDRLIGWHRRLAPWALYLLAAHITLITLGYAQAAGTDPLTQIWRLLTEYPEVLPAAAGAGLLAMAGVTSYRRARARMAYETWWAVHLYTYLGLGLSFLHQVDNGAPFVGHPLARLWWYTLWLGTLATVLAFRVALPLYRSWRHGLRIAQIVPAGPRTWAVTLTGRDLDRLPAAGGQFLLWRFLRRGLWWQAHPYSLSAAPRGSQLRITVKELGDHSSALARLTTGTRVAFEGPYGTFTQDTRTARDVVLVGAGVGATPIRALLGELPEGTHAVVVLRGHRREHIAHLDEFERILGRRRGGQLHVLTGPREHVRLDGDALRELVPDIAAREVYVCGPVPFTGLVVDAATAAGVPAHRIHHEDFSF